MINPQKFRPKFASERLLPRTINGFNGCRLSAAWSGIAVATLGESTLVSNGRHKNSREREADLRKMLNSTGEPNRAGFNQSHVASINRAIADKVPEIWVGTFEEMWDDRDAAFTIAGNPQDIKGASTLEKLARARGWATASHELLLLHTRSDTHGIVYDPMHTQSESYKGDKVPKVEIIQFMRSDALKAGNKPVAERYPLGGWTLAAQVARRKNAAIDLLETEHKREETRLRNRIAELEAGGADVEALLKAERGRVLGLVKEHANSLL